MARDFDRGYGRQYDPRGDWDRDREDWNRDDDRSFGAGAYRSYRRSLGSGFDYDRDDYDRGRTEGYGRERDRGWHSGRENFERGGYGRGDYDRDDDRDRYSSGHYFYEGRRYASDRGSGSRGGWDHGPRRDWGYEHGDFGDRNDFGRDFDVGRGDYGRSFGWERGGDRGYGMERDFGVERGYGRGPDPRSFDRGVDYYDRGYREGRRSGRPYERNRY